MTDVTHDSRLQKTIINLLSHYSFDSGNRPIHFIMADWLGCYPLRWILSAVIEALYQGRYKTISVEQILIIWQRRGRPLHHFSGEFERMVCGPLFESEKNIEYEKNISNGHSGPSAEAIAPELPPAPASPQAVAEPQPKLNTQKNTIVKKGTSQDVLLSSLEPSGFECNDRDCMGQDGRLSELLTDLPNHDDSQRHNSPSSTGQATTFTEVLVNDSGNDSGMEHSVYTSTLPTQTLAMSQASLELKQWDAETHKVPVPSFEPVQTETPSDWRLLQGTVIRHYPIHQFKPMQASPTMYNKLKAIASTL